MAIKARRKAIARARIKKTGAEAIKLDRGFEYFAREFHIEVESRQSLDIVKKYVRDNFSKKDSNAILKTEDWNLKRSRVGAYCYWLSLGNDAPEDTVQFMQEYFKDLIAKGSLIVKEIQKIEKKQTVKPSIQDRMREQLSEIIGHLDAEFDDLPADPKFFDFLKIKNVPQVHISKIRSYYEPILAEYKQLTQRKCSEDLKEGYSHLSKEDLKRSINWLTTLMTDLDAYEGTKKATRKRRVSKPKSADKLVQNVKYKKEDTTYKVTSIDPINIIDASILYVFNAKTRVFTVYKTDGKLSMKGTTLQNFDDKESFSIKLRKPQEILPQVLKTTERKIDKMLGELNVKRTTPNGRINADTVILRANK
jgi:hypothetical protein